MRAYRTLAAIVALGLPGCGGQTLEQRQEPDAGSPAADAGSTVADAAPGAQPDSSDPVWHEEGGGEASNPSWADATVDVWTAHECSTLIPQGPPVLIVFKEGPPPIQGAGGTLLDGIYDLAECTIYQSAPSSEQFFRRAAIHFSNQGTRVEYVNLSASGELTQAYALAPSGVNLNSTPLCPVGESIDFGTTYTATAEQFIQINGLYVNVYLRRPGQ